MSIDIKAYVEAVAEKEIFLEKKLDMKGYLQKVLEIEAKLEEKLNIEGRVCANV